MSLDTPKYNLCQFPDVYDPAEDTFLLLDALEQETSFIKSLNPLIVCEVGSGSGIVITALAAILKNSSVCFSTDINFQACLATTNTSLMNNVLIHAVNMNLLFCFKAKFDLIVFNPPYVVTESSEIFGTGINCSWAGGQHGREVLDNLLSNLPDLLSPKGYPVIGYEINQEWWQSKYSNPTFIVLKYVDKEKPVLQNAYSLLFCYFNNGTAFREYVKSYTGRMIIIIGPSEGSGRHSDPQPFSVDFGESSWKLFQHREVSDTKDFIAIYLRN